MLMIMSTIPLLMSLFMMKENMFILMKIPLSNIYSMLIPIDIMFDWMSMMFLGTVMLVSSLIIMYSLYYIPNMEYKQFLLLLLMFVLSMSILILSNNLFLILLGWDGLGLSSYILVIYYQNFPSAASGTITLLSNRIGDIMILLSSGLLTISSNWNFNMNSEYSLMIMMLLILAACSKSAQYPFSAWLPMAMAAPTPISALVHSSTLVTAGVFLMLRISTYLHPNTMFLLIIISSMTAMYSSMSANWEQDMKKIIALSTLSQIAMMMFAISLNSLILAFMHLIIHAMFKSAMFLCAGIMIHESSYQDTRMMGINFSNLPLTLSMLGINSMALMGIPFMSGFFSKDMIIENLIIMKTNMFLYMLMIMSIGMTASYTMRMSFQTNKSYIKINPIQSNHISINAVIPITMLSLMAISSGSWLTWIVSPEQMFLISIKYKIFIILCLTTGLMLGFMLQFKNKKFIKMGMSSISLWFNHLTSTTPIIPMYHPMQMFHNIDKQWQEKYGPNQSYNLLYMANTLPEMSKSSMLFSLMLMSLIPLFMF
uniref:NADH-ubiquinone oxidoreductase chain 5 n=1 Tax=Phanuelus gladstone TaxID=2059714 RepID=A0A7U0R6K9_9ARAC|nr:NADH dehydrogenase subunit 5 [Phanuelus gladstone]QQX28279.1 NADH dehydrogenase subunit 5 [Phanuelus gladstone]